MANEKQNNFFKMLVKMVKTEGIKSIFKGLEASLILVVNPLIQFFVYEMLKLKFGKSKLIFLINKSSKLRCSCSIS